MSRPRIPALALFLALSLALPLTLSAGAVQAAENPYEPLPFEFEVEKVEGAPVYYATGRSGVPDTENAGHTSNGGYVITDEGVVVFDALGTPALGWALLQDIRERTDVPVRFVVVSHYHADHVYGLQAFDEHTDAWVVAQEGAVQYVNPETRKMGEDAERRLEQRRQALFPWVDESTYLVAPDIVFDPGLQLSLGGVSFRIKHMGPAHAPGDALMVVPEHGIVFSGDVIYNGRIPFLDSPDVNSANWLEGLSYLSDLDMDVRLVIPGHGRAYADMEEAIAFTRDYIQYVREQMGAAVENFVSFEQAYRETDWSRYEDMPAFDASNRGNAYRIYLEMEQAQF